MRIMTEILLAALMVATPAMAESHHTYNISADEIKTCGLPFPEILKSPCGDFYGYGEEMAENPAPDFSGAVTDEQLSKQAAIDCSYSPSVPTADCIKWETAGFRAGQLEGH
jgi:hypothetical protein